MCYGSDFPLHRYATVTKYSTALPRRQSFFTLAEIFYQIVLIVLLLIQIISPM